jgi:hypothetical protein
VTELVTATHSGQSYKPRCRPWRARLTWPSSNQAAPCRTSRSVAAHLSRCPETASSSETQKMMYHLWCNHVYTLTVRASDERGDYKPYLYARTGWFGTKLEGISTVLPWKSIQDRIPTSRTASCGGRTVVSNTSSQQTVPWCTHE